AQSLLAFRGERSGNPCQVFHSYEDPNAKPFFEGYGMKEPRSELRSRLALRPWIKIRESSIHVEDPHRGPKEWSEPPEGTVEIVDREGNRLSVREDFAQTLLREGFASP